MISYLQWLDRAFVIKQPKKIVRGKDRHTDPIISIHLTENIILNNGALFLSVYQEESKIR